MMKNEENENHIFLQKKNTKKHKKKTTGKKRKEGPKV